MHTAAASPHRTFALKQRVYYQHTDAGGVVYHARYLDFMEAARTELLESAGVQLAELAGEEPVFFIVYALSVDYHRPARLHDELVVSATVERLGRARVIFEQRVMRGDERLVSARVSVACVDARTYTPVPVPEAVRLAFESEDSPSRA